MAPAVRLAFALLFFPSLILSEPLHVTLTHRRQPNSIRTWTDEANKLRRRYGYPIASRRRSNSRAVVDIPMIDQVDIIIVIVLYQLIAGIGFRY